mmetsp:Transcript_141547/g.394477  ORF Transcript_141547/g.394477 Transcript_141547/m.394477 type:complete len:217 (+) Transcript_141547:749-1399(+)
MLPEAHIASVCKADHPWVVHVEDILQLTEGSEDLREFAIVKRQGISPHLAVCGCRLNFRAQGHLQFVNVQGHEPWRPFAFPPLRLRLLLHRPPDRPQSDFKDRAVQCLDCELRSLWIFKRRDGPPAAGERWREGRHCGELPERFKLDSDVLDEVLGREALHVMREVANDDPLPRGLGRARFALHLETRWGVGRGGWPLRCSQRNGSSLSACSHLCC